MSVKVAEQRFIAKANHDTPSGDKCKAVLSVLADRNSLPDLPDDRNGSGWHLDPRLMNVRWLGECPSCGNVVLMTAKPVKGKYSASQECTARCQNATGFDCECQCAGRMHGGSHDGAH